MQNIKKNIKEVLKKTSVVVKKIKYRENIKKIIYDSFHKNKGAVFLMPTEKEKKIFLKQMKSLMSENDFRRLSGALSRSSTNDPFFYGVRIDFDNYSYFFKTEIIKHFSTGSIRFYLINRGHLPSILRDENLFFLYDEKINKSKNQKIKNLNI